MSDESARRAAEPGQTRYARWFLPPRVIIVGVVFVLVVWLAHVLALQVCATLSLGGCAPYWPISVFDFRAPPRVYYPNLSHVMAGLGSLAVFFLAVRILHRSRYRASLVILFGFVLILGSNLIQGWEYGLRRPIDGLGIRTNQYYHDALKIQDPVAFFRHYPESQLTLQNHSRSHPPGAVLTIYLLARLVHSPAFVSLAIGLLAVSISGMSLYSLMRVEHDAPGAGYLTFLLFLLPAIQIYYLASLDALIVALMLATLSLAISREGAPAAVAGGIVFVLLSMLTFLFVFAVPPMLYYWFRSPSRSRSIPITLGVFVLIHLLISKLTGFSYVQSFLTASRLENPNGYGLLLEPLSFIMIRIEGLAELMLFAGPFVLLAAFAGWRLAERNPGLTSLASAGVVSLVALMAAGVYRTGETARAALFMYPLLILPVGVMLKKAFSWRSLQAEWLLSLTFLQGILMQFIGTYFW